MSRVKKESAQRKKLVTYSKTGSYEDSWGQKKGEKKERKKKAFLEPKQM